MSSAFCVNAYFRILRNFISIILIFQILASLFVLSVVAEPEAEPQHHTAGFVAYTNGALVPEVRIISDQKILK